VPDNGIDLGGLATCVTEEKHRSRESHVFKRWRAAGDPDRSLRCDARSKPSLANKHSRATPFKQEIAMNEELQKQSDRKHNDKLSKHQAQHGGT
jgi:hypothetical protein